VTGTMTGVWRGCCFCCDWNYDWRVAAVGGDLVVTATFAMLLLP